MATGGSGRLRVVGGEQGQAADERLAPGGGAPDPVPADAGVTVPAKPVRIDLPPFAGGDDLYPLADQHPGGHGHDEAGRCKTSAWRSLEDSH